MQIFQRGKPGKSVLGMSWCAILIAKAYVQFELQKSRAEKYKGNKNLHKSLSGVWECFYLFLEALEKVCGFDLLLHFAQTNSAI